MEFVNSATVPLYEFRFACPNDKNTHIGTTVRFASYITAIARVNLMRGVLACADNLGLNSVCYGDTDSIMLDLPLNFVEEDIYNSFRKEADIVMK